MSAPRLVERRSGITGVATDESLRAVVAWLGAKGETETALYISERIGADATKLAQATCAARDALQRRGPR